MRRGGPCSCHDSHGLRAAAPCPGRCGYGRAIGPAHRYRADDRRRRGQPVRRGDRRAGLPGAGARRGGGGTPVGSWCPAPGGRAAEVRLVHPRAMAPRPGAGIDLRHDEPVALRGRCQDRAGPCGDPGVSRPAVGGPARLAARHRPRVCRARRNRRGGPGQAPAEHGLRRHLPCPAGRRLLGRVHPGEPGRGRPATGHSGARGRGRPVGAAVRSGRHLGTCQPSGHRGRAGPRGHGRAAVLGCPDGR